MRCQAIASTDADVFLRDIFKENLNLINNIAIRENAFRMSSAACRPYCRVLNVLVMPNRKYKDYVYGRC